MASVAQIQRLPRVDHIDDERGVGNGIIVTLKQGWTFSKGEDNRVRRFDGVHEADLEVKAAQKFEGPYQP